MAPPAPQLDNHRIYLNLSLPGLEERINISLLSPNTHTVGLHGTRILYCVKGKG
jgi:hypothetical protein